MPVELPSKLLGRLDEEIEKFQQGSMNRDVEIQHAGSSKLVDNQPRPGSTIKLFLTICCLILAASLTGQVEHAPTVAQCQADQRLWLPQIESSDSTLTYDVLSQRASEMSDCASVDPPNNVRYVNTYSEATAVRLMRLSHYVQRHELWMQFEAEDAAGKRTDVRILTLGMGFSSCFANSYT